MRTRTRKPTGATSSLPATTLTWPYIIAVLLCAGLIGAGFFFAAKQHFMSMENGIKLSKLRQQLEGLENENRRLRLAKEVALSPAELRRAYRTVAVAAVAKPVDGPSDLPRPAASEKKVPSEPDRVIVPAALQQAPKASAIQVSAAPSAVAKKPAPASAGEKQKRPDPSLAIAKLDNK